jgi:hypothetical protein
MVQAAQVDLYLAFLRKEIQNFFADWGNVSARGTIESIYFG